MELNSIFLKDKLKWLRIAFEDVHHPYLSEKCKLNYFFSFQHTMNNAKGSVKWDGMGIQGRGENTRRGKRSFKLVIRKPTTVEAS